MDTTKTIILWRFHDAPEELQIPYNGGDEDFVILFHQDQYDDFPHKMESLGCASNDFYRVNEDGTVDERDETRTFDDRTCEEKTTWTRTDWTCPNYPGYMILIPCHS